MLKYVAILIAILFLRSQTLVPNLNRHPRICFMECDAIGRTSNQQHILGTRASDWKEVASKRREDVNILTMLNAAIDHSGYLTPQLIVSALSACREIDDWQSALQVYNLAKTAVRDGRLKVKTLPSIIYGQTLVVLAKGGAESQTFQLICDMLEAGVTPTTTTLDHTFLELSKRGAYKAMMSVLDQLQRYRITVSNMSLNSILNACDKAGEYKFAVDLFVRGRVKPHQVDEVGLSVLIKACDKENDAESAMKILDAIEYTGVLQINSAYYSRILAIFVKTGAYHLAVRLLLRIENVAILRNGNKQKDPDSYPWWIDPPLINNDQNSPSLTKEIFALHSDSMKKTLGEAKIESRKSTWRSSTENSLISGADFLHAQNKCDESIYVDRNQQSKVTKAQFTSDIFDFDDSVFDGIDDERTSGINTYDSETVDSFENFEEQLKELCSLTSIPNVEPQMYAAAISSLSRRGKANEASQLLKSYLGRGGVPLIDMFTSTIYAHRYTLDPDGAEEIFRQLAALAVASMHYKSQNEIETNSNALPTSNIASSSGFRHVDEFNNTANLRETLRVTTSAFNALLTVYAVSNVTVTRNKKLLSEMEKMGLQWTSFTYTAVMMHTNNYDPHDVISLWDQMITAGIRPTAASLLEFLKACISGKNGTKAVEAVKWIWNDHDVHIFKEEPPDLNMQNLRSKDSVPSSGGVKRNPMPTHSQSARESTPRKVVPDLKICSKVLLALNQDNKTAESIEFLDLMREKGISPSYNCYVIVLNTLERVGDWKRAVNLLLQMQVRGIRIEVKAANAAIAACSRSGQWSMVMKLYELMPSLTGHKFIPNQYSFAQAINAASKLKNTTAALSIFDKMLSQANILPSASTSSLVISLLESEGRFEESAAIFEKTVASHLDSEVIFNNLIALLSVYKLYYTHPYPSLSIIFSISIAS